MSETEQYNGTHHGRQSSRLVVWRGMKEPQDRSIPIPSNASGNQPHIFPIHGVARILAWRVSVLVIALITFSTLAVLAQQSTTGQLDKVTIRGKVVDTQGKPAADAAVRLTHPNSAGTLETKTDAQGDFTFPSLAAGSYLVTAEKGSRRSNAAAILVSAEDLRIADLVLANHDEAQRDSVASREQTIEFSDKPDFAVAGVTDWTAVGGHGSDSVLRTSEALARDLLTLKPEKTSVAVVAAPGGERNSETKLRAEFARAPDSFEANHRLGQFYLSAARYKEAARLLESAYRIAPADYENAYDLALALEGMGDYMRAQADVKLLLAHRDDSNLHRLAGELDEKLNDPLAAVHEYELAAKENPTELNYFEWGSELLLHRAVWQAQEVFRNAVQAYPKSERLLTALGAALFAGAIYDEASQRLCTASDLNPGDPEPYTFMGNIEMSAPNPLPCIEPRLARFARQQPQNSTANYLYAMAVLKRPQQPLEPEEIQKAETLLRKSVALDPGCAGAWLQLGIISFDRHDLSAAIDDYRKAIASDPQLGEAYYRLGVAYDRTGDVVNSRREFELHDQIEKARAEAVERQRKQIQQFLVVPSAPSSQLSKQ